MSDEIETIDRNPKSWAAWKREAERLQKIIDDMAAMDSEPVAYIFKHPAGRLFWSLTDESNKGHDDVMPVYASPQPSPVVPSDVLNHLEHEANHVTAWHHMDEHSCKVNRRDLLTLINAIRDAQPAPVIPDNSVIGWLRYDYQESIKKVGGPLFILGANDPSDAWGLKYMPVAKAGEQQSAPQNIPEIIPDSCTWHCEEDINNWHSDCGYQFQFMEDGPEENGVKFCPKCGKSVAVSATEGTEE